MVIIPHEGITNTLLRNNNASNNKTLIYVSFLLIVLYPITSLAAAFSTQCNGSNTVSFQRFVWRLFACNSSTGKMSTLSSG